MTRLKANYKVFNTISKKYISANRKSTWVEEYAVANFVKKLVSKRILKLNEIEIHKFPVESAIVIDSSEFMLEVQTRLAERKEKQIKSSISKWEKEYLTKKLVELENEISIIKSKLK